MKALLLAAALAAVFTMPANACDFDRHQMRCDQHLARARAPAHAQQQRTAPMRPMLTNVLPPVEFDHAFRGKMIIRTMGSAAEMGAACGWHLSDKLGCASANVQRTACLIYLRSDAEIRRQGWTRAIVLRHEIGHCNGWSPSHYGARSLGVVQR